MTVYKEFKVGGGSSPFGFLGPLVGMAVFFAIMYFVAKGVFSLLSWLAIPLFIGTLILDYKVVVDYFAFIIKLLKENILMGVLAVVVTFFAYPFVTGFLFFKALAKRQVNKLVDRVEKEKSTFADYEEVKEEEAPFLELPQMPKPKQATPQSRGNDYDDMFK